MSNSITGLEDINGAVNTAMSICWDESHGYRLGGTLNPDTDCSGLIYYALTANGFDVGSDRWDTQSMIRILRNYGGFAEYTYTSGFQLKHGDICVHRETSSGHACMIAENVLAYTANVYDYAPQSTLYNYPNTTGIVPLAKIEAYGTRGHPANGDQEVNHDSGVSPAHAEVFVHKFEGLSSSYVWHIFRWQGEPPTPHGNLPIWLYFKLRGDI